MQNKLIEWEHRLNVAQTGHYVASERYQKIEHFLGIPLVVLSTFVSAFLFFDNIQGLIMYLLKASALLVAILAAIQTFIRPSEKAEMHRVKATKYGSLKRKVEIFICHHSSPEELETFCDQIVAAWNAIAEDSPVTPHSIRKLINGRLNVGIPESSK